MTTKISPAGIVVALGWLCVFIAVSLFRPLMPVDETRYLSVAWEMMLQHRWLLPTLNFEPYAHKPPLLFWLARLGWEIFGIGITGPRIFVFAWVGAMFYLTSKLARTMFPDDARIAPRAMLLLAALPMFVVYASTIMFDSLLAVFVLGAILAVWQAAKAPGAKPWICLGLALGCGALTKGPVTLIYMLPAALLAPWWLKDRAVNWKRWYGGIGIAVAIGFAIGLAWAIPAAIQGGPEYAQKIFVTQSARRMVQAFDHVRPWWFYIPSLIGYLLPLLLWPALWRKPTIAPAAQKPLKFLICWAGPAFLFFSAISSKQIHYMLPILPAFTIAAAWLTAQDRDDDRKWGVALPLLLLVAPSALLLGDVMAVRMGMTEIPTLASVMTGFRPWMALLHIALIGVIAGAIYKRPALRFEGLAAGAFLMVAFLHAHLGGTYLPRFDLTRLAQAASAYSYRPMAATPKYDGEYGFVLRATKPIESIGRENVAAWFSAHPDGVVIARYKGDTIPSDYDILYRQDFRTDEVLVIMQRKVMVGLR